MTDEDFKLFMLRGDIKQNMFRELQRMQSRNKSIEEQVDYAIAWFSSYMEDTQGSHYGAITLQECFNSLQVACDEITEPPDEETAEYYDVLTVIDPELADVIGLIVYRLSYMLRGRHSSR